MEREQQLRDAGPARQLLGKSRQRPHGDPARYRPFPERQSGKNGIAWVGTLCNTPQAQQITCGTTSYSTYSGGFGVTQGIDGTFNPLSPTVVWDIYGTTHELGHNFGSPH